jgi:hypothetical protein
VDHRQVLLLSQPSADLQVQHLLHCRTEPL